MKEEIRVGSLVRIKNTERTALVVERITHDIAKKESYFTFENLDEPIILWRLALVEPGKERVDAYLQSQHLEVISR
jgi:hypothetical protein